MPPSSAFLVEGFTWVTDSREIVRKRAAFAQSMLQLKKDRAKILGRIRQTHRHHLSASTGGYLPAPESQTPTPPQESGKVEEPGYVVCD